MSDGKDYEFLNLSIMIAISRLTTTIASVIRIRDLTITPYNRRNLHHVLRRLGVPFLNKCPYRRWLWLRRCRPCNPWTRSVFACSVWEATIEYMAITEGLQDMNSLARHPLVSLDNYVDDMAKGYSTAFAKVTPPTILWPASAKRNKLRELRAWIDYRQARGEDLDVAAYTVAVEEKWERRLTELEVREKAKLPPPKIPTDFLVLTDWIVWAGNSLGYLGLFRNAVTGVKLTYLVR